MALQTIWGATLPTDDYAYRTVLDTEQNPPVEVQLIDINYKGLKDIVAGGTPEMIAWMTYFLGTFAENTPDTQVVLIAGMDGNIEV